MAAGLAFVQRAQPGERRPQTNEPAVVIHKAVELFGPASQSG